MYLFDHVKRVARDRQVKPVTDKSTASKIFHGLAIGKRDLPTLKKVYGKQAGFSLVELTVVVAIVGILSVIAIPYYQTFAKKAERVEAKTGLSGAFTMMTIYQLEHQGKGTSDMTKAGFSMRGNPNYAFGFDNHSVGSATSNKAYHASNSAGANVGNTSDWTSAVTRSSSAFGGTRKKCQDVVIPSGTSDKPAYCTGVGCRYNSGGNCLPPNGEPSSYLSNLSLVEGLSIGLNTFTIGAVSYFGDGDASDATGLDDFDTLTISHNRNIEQINNPLE